MNSNASPADPASPAVVFIHGIGGNARIWGPQLASFAAAGFRPLAVDLPGYGTREPVDRMDFDMLAADVEAQVARLGLDRPIVLGHSMGGMVAQTLLRRGPQAWRAAVLSCTSPAFGDPTGKFQKKFVADRIAPLDAGHTMAQLAPAMVASVSGSAPDPAGRKLAIETIATTSERSYRAAVHCLVGFDERANLPHIGVPVLCLAGEHDRLAPPAVMERMAARIPAARYVCLQGVGHLPNIEAPPAFDAAVLDFLRTALAPVAA
ncbi:MAG: alpha/beta fold hydrolase [Hyphomicrobiales bacterium]|nr:alpha/beta fold hydrolase [Hyphomicrobiales bacterium]